MSLTGGSLLALVIGLTVGCVVALVVLWPRLGSRHPVAVLARVLALLLLCLLTVLSAAVALNDQYLFYVDWSDLLGASSTASSSGQAGAPVASVFAAPSASAGSPVHQGTASSPGFPLPASPTTPPPLPAPMGIDPHAYSYTVTGTRSGLTGQVIVLTPPGYDPHRQYPVLVIPPTYPGSPQGTLQSSQIARDSRALVATHRLAPTLIVIPTTAFPGAKDSECVTWPQGPAAETWIAQDIPDWIARTFPVQHRREAWAMLGVSAGAYCGSATVLLHPDLFSAGISLGGYFIPTFTGAPPFAPGSPEAKHYDLVALAGSAPPPVAMWVQTTRQDPESGPTSLAFIAAARSPLAVQSVIEQSGGHRWAVWRPLVMPALTWLGKVSPAFRAS